MRLAALAAALAWLCGVPPSQSGWEYVVPGADAAPAQPWTPLLLSDTAPDDVEVELAPRGPVRFGELRYGDASSPRITVALVEPEGAPPLLYVDADRGRVLDERDLLAGDGTSWRTTLQVFVGPLGARRVARQVGFQLGRTRVLLGYATLGHVEGEVDLDGRRVRARRVDADGNGFVSDAGDRLWLDLDGDGRWSAFEEQLSCAPILWLGGRRFALHSDRLGEELELAPIEGTGRVRFELPPLAGELARRVDALQVLLVGEDGSAVGVGAHGEALEAPVGRYRLGTLTLTLPDAQGGDPWTYVFSDGAGVGEPRWYELERGGELEIDPIGALRLVAVVETSAGAVVAGSSWIVSPRLHTGDGLLINACYRGNRPGTLGARSCGASVRLLAPDGTLLDESRSGFA